MRIASLVLVLGLAPSVCSRAAESAGDEALFERLVLAEASGQGQLGMALVARSVLNRAALIRAGIASPGIYEARSGALGDVIRGSGQYQPLRDGRIDLPWTPQQRAQARQAIALARDTNALEQQLARGGLSSSDAERLLSATGFRAPTAFHDPSQAYAQQRYGGHVFNGDVVSRGARVRDAFQRVFGGSAPAPAVSAGQGYSSPLFPTRQFETPQALLSEFQRLMDAAAEQGSTFANNRPFFHEGEKYGWAQLKGRPIPVLWGSVAGTSGGGSGTAPGGQSAGGTGVEAGPDAAGGSPDGSHVNQRLVARYGTPAGYQAVEREVRRFYPPFRKNGCVAFMSEALRQAGVKVPSGDASLVTLPFSRHLEGTLGWTRVTSLAQLRPGDVCFTRDDPSWPGYPAHTFMFLGWKDRGRNLADVVDNQGFTHTRNLTVNDHANYNFTPFSYALRAPR